MSFIAKLMEGFKSLVLGADPLTTEESRISPRILCQYRVNMRNAGSDFKCSIVDIGTTGMRLEGVPRLEKGQHFRISYPFAEAFKEEYSFEVEVMWCRSRDIDDELVAGVRFLQTGDDLRGTWVHTLLSEVGLIGDAVYQKRQHVRLTTHQKVFFRDVDTGHHILEGKVNNISIGGALVESESDMRAGRRVLALIGPNVNFPTLAIHAKVIASRLDPDDDHHLLSLQFVDVSREELRLLESLVVNMLEGRTLG
jgi:c-di-GMP-binding flagellar brake protein YcgR